MLYIKLNYITIEYIIIFIIKKIYMKSPNISIAFGKSILISYNEPDHKDKIELIKDKNNNSFFDYNIGINNNKIDVYQIIKLISNGILFDNEYEIQYTNDNYLVKYKGLELNFNDILTELFNKIKKIVKDSIDYIIKDIFITFEKDIPYKLKIIMKTVGLLCNLNILKFNDSIISIKYYLEMNHIITKEFSSSIIVKRDKTLEFCVFNMGIKIYKGYIESDETLSYKILSDDEFQIFNKEKNGTYYNNFLSIIRNQIEHDMGKQDFEIQELYLFEKKDDNSFLKYLSIGGLYSEKYQNFKEYEIIIKFIDYEEKKKQLIKTFSLSNGIIFSASKSTMKILNEYKAPYNDCFYISLPFEVKGGFAIDKYSVPITIYFNQINYLYASIELTDTMYNYELIFYKKVPEILIYDKEINIEEKFEEDSSLNRINIVNIGLRDIKIKGVSEDTKIEYENIESNQSIIFDSDLNIILNYPKTIFQFKKEESDIVKMENTKNLRISEKINSKLTEEEIETFNKEFIKTCGKLNDYIYKKYNKKDYEDMNNCDIKILKSYNILSLYADIFFRNPSIDKKKRYSLFKKLFTNLENFGNIIKKVKDERLESLLFISACIALSKIAEKKEKIEETKNIENLIDLIDFSEDTIYRDALNNNINFIFKLKRKSFIFNYLLQFNSSSKLFDIEDIYTNKSKKAKISIISMLSLYQLKYDLIKSLPRFGIRLYFNAFDDYASTIITTSITLFNEINIFGKPLTLDELSNKNDKNFKKRVCLSFIIKHERFCHIKKIFNKNDLDYINSPIGFLDFDNSKEVFFSYNIDEYNNLIGELGETFENIIFDNKRRLIFALFKTKNINLEKLFNNDIWVKENNKELIDELTKVVGENYIENESNTDFKNEESIKSPIKTAHFSLDLSKNYNKNIFIIKGNNKNKNETQDNDIVVNKDKIFKITHTFKKNLLKKITKKK